MYISVPTWSSEPAMRSAPSRRQAAEETGLSAGPALLRKAIERPAMLAASTRPRRERIVVLNPVFFMGGCRGWGFLCGLCYGASFVVVQMARGPQIASTLMTSKKCYHTYDDAFNSSQLLRGRDLSPQRESIDKITTRISHGMHRKGSVVASGAAKGAVSGRRRAELSHARVRVLVVANKGRRPLRARARHTCVHDWLYLK